MSNPTPIPQAVALSDLNELAKVYGSSYASPHHIVFTVEGLRNFIAALSSGEAAVSDTSAGGL